MNGIFINTMMGIATGACVVGAYLQAKEMKNIEELKTEGEKRNIRELAKGAKHKISNINLDELNYFQDKSE